jgi:hypothetical protein
MFPVLRPKIHLSKLSEFLGALYSTGGHLVIGIYEGRGKIAANMKGYPKIGKNYIVGLGHDFKMAGGDPDAFTNLFLSKLRQHVDPVVGKQLRIEYPTFSARRIAEIRVPQGKKYYFFNDDFYLRIQNRTQKLTTQEAMKYQSENPR